MTDPPGVEVRGGVGGTAVGLDELVAAAGQLADAASVLGEVLGRLVTAAAEAGVSAPLSPVTAARAEAELAAAVHAVAVEAAALAGVALAVRSAAWAYREVEEEVVRSNAFAQDVVMAAAGYAAPTLVVGVVTLEALGVDVGALVDRGTWEVPEVAELAGGSGGLVVGLRTNPVTAPFLAPPHRASSGPYGRAGPAGDEVDADERAVRALADSAAAWGLLSDTGGVRVTPVAPGPGGATRVSPPTGVADLARDQSALPEDGVVRVVEVRGEQGASWVVEIGGTQVWDARAGSNPFDLTTDVRAMAAESTVLAAGVQQALAAAQSSAAAQSCATSQSGARSLPGSATADGDRRDVAAEPVLLSGHSLGGIVAAGLASSADFRSAHRVTHVVALGSPIGKVPVPTDVQVLAVEHRQDPVPRLEGRANPDRAGWVTVSRDLDGAAGVEERVGAAHRSERYVETAAGVDTSGDPSVAAWRAGTGRFFPGAEEASTAVVRDYRIERLVPPR